MLSSIEQVFMEENYTATAVNHIQALNDGGQNVLASAGLLGDINIWMSYREIHWLDSITADG